jgi:hypothetical protein
LGKLNMNVCGLALDRANTVLQFADIVARSVHHTTYVAKMLKNNVVGLNHHFEAITKVGCCDSDS